MVQLAHSNFKARFQIFSKGNTVLFIFPAVIRSAKVLGARKLLNSNLPFLQSLQIFMARRLVTADDHLLIYG
jgi:hypothetical protein